MAERMLWRQTRQTGIFPYFSETEELLRGIEEIAVRARYLEEENRRLRAALRAREQQIRESDEIANQITRLSRSVYLELVRAMTLVAEFAFGHCKHLDGVLLGLADGGFRFVFLTKGEGFDWELTEELVDLEAAMQQTCPNLPVSCIPVPAPASDDLPGPILAQRLSELAGLTEECN